MPELVEQEDAMPAAHVETLALCDVEARRWAIGGRLPRPLVKVALVALSDGRALVAGGDWM